MEIVKDLIGNPAVQACIVTVVGKSLQAGAEWLQKSHPASPQASAVLRVVVMALSLVMGFIEQWSNNKLDAFDPKPWIDFITVLSASWGMIVAAEKGKEKAVKLSAKVLKMVYKS